MNEKDAYDIPLLSPVKVPWAEVFVDEYYEEILIIGDHALVAQPASRSGVE